MTSGAARDSPARPGRDAHGDIVWTANAAGSISATLAYDPFGNLLAST